MSGRTKWKYKDVCSFLESNDFTRERTSGSHEQWLKTAGDKDFLVTVYYATGNKHYPPDTLSSMIRQSGLGGKIWDTWKRGK